MTKKNAVPGPAETTQSLTPLQDHFLEKLTRLLERRQAYVGEPTHDATLLKVLDRAIYVTYLDCLSQNIAEMAQAQVDKYRNPAANGAPSTN